MKRNKTTLKSAVIKYISSNPTRFHVPGHKGKGLSGHVSKCFFDKNFYRWDVTEVYGLDNLHEPSGPIRYSQARLAKLYGADTSYFLVNGSSSGIVAMIGSCLKPNQKIIVPRTCHKSIISGLILSGAVPEYIVPEWDANLGVYTQISPKKVKNAFLKNPDAKAALFANPEYLGFCTDLEMIRKITDEYGAFLLVDEAHGPHFAFSPMLPKSAGQIKADVWVQSPHKMLFSLTQSAWMHVKGNHIDVEKLKQYINLITTTSPSYILMSSLDQTREMMEKQGKYLVEKAVMLSERTRQRINAHTQFYCVGSEIKGYKSIYDIDLSRLVVNVSCAGYTGFEVKRALRKRFNIIAEYADKCNVCFLVTFFNMAEDMRKLVYALSTFKKMKTSKSISPLTASLPKKALEPREAFLSDGEWVLFGDSVGRIVKRAIVPYPPGIPILMPGEVIEPEHLYIVKELLRSGASCHGLRGGNEVFVTRETS
jgi:arginine decarboxylase